MGSGHAGDENMPVSMPINTFNLVSRWRLPRRPRRHPLKRRCNQIWTAKGRVIINNPTFCASDVGSIACQSAAAGGINKNTLAAGDDFLAIPLRRDIKDRTTALLNDRERTKTIELI